METLQVAYRIAYAFGTVLAACTALACTALAQSGTAYNPSGQEVSLSGPRFGITYLSPGIMDWAKARDANFRSPVISQFGWQFEKQMDTGEGPTAVSELVLLAGGLEEGLFIPSASWVVGLRTRSGLEFGVGPNVSPTGFALVAAGGMTTHVGALNVPFNFVVVPSKDGVRLSLLTGFSVQPRVRGQ